MRVGAKTGKCYKCYSPRAHYYRTANGAAWMCVYHARQLLGGDRRMTMYHCVRCKVALGEGVALAYCDACRTEPRGVTYPHERGAGRPVPNREGTPYTVPDLDEWLSASTRRANAKCSVDLLYGDYDRSYHDRERQHQIVRDIVAVTAYADWGVRV